MLILRCTVLSTVRLKLWFKRKDGRPDYFWAHFVSFPQIVLATSKGKDTLKILSHRMNPKNACLLQFSTMSPTIATLPERRLIELLFHLGDPLIPSTSVHIECCTCGTMYLLHRCEGQRMMVSVLILPSLHLVPLRQGLYESGAKMAARKSNQS